MMKHSAAAKVAAGNDVTRWRGSVWLPSGCHCANASIAAANLHVLVAPVGQSSYSWRGTEIQREMKRRVENQFGNSAGNAPCVMCRDVALTGLENTAPKCPTSLSRLSPIRHRYHSDLIHIQKANGKMRP